MYDVSPRARTAWGFLFQWLASTTGIPLEDVEYPAPRPLGELWARDDLGCVFMCGWPFSRARPQPLPIAAPIPCGERYGNQPIYFTDLIVRRDRGSERLEDTFGGRIGWTAEGSHSGFNALRHHLLPYRERPGQPLYAQSIGPLVTPSRALESVVEGVVDVAPLDSYALDLITAHTPERVRDIRILVSTAPAPIPLLVASPGLSPDRMGLLREALQRAPQSVAIAPVLDELCLNGFSAVSAPHYELLDERARLAEDAGYAQPF